MGERRPQMHTRKVSVLQGGRSRDLDASCEHSETQHLQKRRERGDGGKMLSKGGLLVLKREI